MCFLGQNAVDLSGFAAFCWLNRSEGPYAAALIAFVVLRDENGYVN